MNRRLLKFQSWRHGYGAIDGEENFPNEEQQELVPPTALSTSSKSNSAAKEIDWKKKSHFRRVFTAALFITTAFCVWFTKSGFSASYFYDMSVCVYMWIAIIGILVFFYINYDEEPIKKRDLILPSPTVVCLVFLSCAVTIGYAYLFTYKWVFLDDLHCDQALEDWERMDSKWEHLIKYITHILYIPLMCYYMFQRDHAGPSNTPEDWLIRLSINSSLCMFGLRFLMLKTFSLFKPYCLHYTPEKRTFLLHFCPPYINENFTCDISALNHDQQAWFYVHNGLLKSMIKTAATELAPVMVIVHLLVCKVHETHDSSDKQQASTQVNNTHDSSDKQQASTQAVRPSAQPQSAKHRLLDFYIRRVLILISMLLVPIASIVWMIYLHDYIAGNLIFGSASTWVELMAIFSKLLLILLLFIWVVGPIADKYLDKDLKEESSGDCRILQVSLWLLSILHFLYAFQFMLTKYYIEGTAVLIICLNVLIFLANLLIYWLEYSCIKKIIALKSEKLNEHWEIPYISVGLAFFNFVEFACWYFVVQKMKHELHHIIESVDGNDFFVVVVMFKTVFTFAGFLYTFTSALYWIEIITRYGSRYFIVGKMNTAGNEPPQNMQIEELD